MVSNCPKCGEIMIVACERVIGFPGRYVEGTRVVYCNSCGPIPTLTLDSQCNRGSVLVGDPIPDVDYE